MFWSQLEGALKALEVESIKQGPHTHKEAKQEQNALILEEVLELVRQQQRILNDPVALLPPSYLEGILGRSELSAHETEALMDLRNAWRSILKFVNSVCNEDALPHNIVAELTELIEKMNPPLEFLFSRNIRAVDRARRRRAMLHDDAGKPTLLAELAKSPIR